MAIKTVLTSGSRPIRPKANADPATGLQKCVDGASVTSNSPYAIRMATNRAAKHEPQSNYGRISIATSVDQVASDDGPYPATAVSQVFFFDPQTQLQKNHQRQQYGVHRVANKGKCLRDAWLGRAEAAACDQENDGRDQNKVDDVIETFGFGTDLGVVKESGR